MFTRILGIVVMICGVALVAMAMYIKSKVEEGKGQIAQAEKKTKQTEQLFSLSPYTQPVGKEIGQQAGKKIGEGKELVGQYETLAGQMQIGGIVVIIVGASIFLLSFRKKKK